MSNKVIWSNHGTTDYAHGLNDEEKKNYLVDRGYDREMLSGDLDSVIADDDYMWQDDAEDFEYNVRPMIENQCRDGKVVLVGSVGRWDGAHNGGAIVNPEDLVNLDKDVDNIEIEDDGNGLIWLGHHHDGAIEMGMYHFSEDADAYKNELEALGVFDNYAKWYDDIEDVWSLSVGDLEPYIDFAKVPEVLPRIVDKMNEGLNEEEQINEVTVKEPKKLKREYKELKKLSDEYGFEYFTSMPLTAYDNDPQSVEYQYPEFFKIVKAFFKEMGIADNVKDNDELDMLWDTNIDQHDWDTLMKTCELCIENKTHSYQIEKIYKNGYATLDDDEILANREKEAERAAEYADEKDESLEETNADKTNKKLKDKEEARRILDIANSGKVGSSEARRLRLLAVKKQLGEDVGDEFIGKKVRIVNLSELPPADFGIDDNATEDEIADYKEMMAHEGEIATITNCVDQVENHSLEGYWDVKFEDGYEIPALADYHMELVEDESLKEASNLDNLSLEEMIDYIVESYYNDPTSVLDEILRTDCADKVIPELFDTIKENVLYQHDLSDDALDNIDIEEMASYIAEIYEDDARSILDEILNTECAKDIIPELFEEIRYTIDEAHNRAAGIHEFGEDPLELDMEDEGEAEGDFFEPWDHGDDEDLNATVYLYSMDYDGTPESLEAIKKDLTDHYVYDEDDEKFVAEVIKRIAAGENGKKESLDKEDFDDLDEETITRLINKKRKRESLIDEEPIEEDTLHRTKEWPWGVPKHLNDAE